MITNMPVLDQTSDPIKVIQVASDTDPKQLALSIKEEVLQAIPVEGQKKPPNISVHAMGAQAINQSIKSVAIANGHLGPRGLVLLILPSFENKNVKDTAGGAELVERTIMRMRLVVWRIGG